jgi:hypothetical protein
MDNSETKQVTGNLFEPQMRRKYFRKEINPRKKNSELVDMAAVLHDIKHSENPDEVLEGALATISDIVGDRKRARAEKLAIHKAAIAHHLREGKAILEGHVDHQIMSVPLLQSAAILTKVPSEYPDDVVKGKEYVDVFCYDDFVEVSFTGTQLEVRDIEVWSTIMKLANERGLKMGEDMFTTVYEITKKMGRPDDQDAYRATMNSIRRLKFAEFRVIDRVHGREVLANPINELNIPLTEADGTNIRIQPSLRLAEMLATFDRVSFALDQLPNLTPTQKRLAFFFATYTDGTRDLRVDKIKKMLQNNQEDRKFRYEIKCHLEGMVGTGLISGFEIYRRGRYHLIRIKSNARQLLCHSRVGDA